MRPASILLCLSFLLVPGLMLQGGQQKAGEKKPQKPRYEMRKNHNKYGTGKFYMNREIAQVMGHRGAAWLERRTREKEEAPSKLHKALQFKPGMVVADIGAGSGYHSFRIANMVGAKGKVYAVDIQKEMLAIIRNRIKFYKIKNVVPVRGKVDDPKLPKSAVDLVLMVDVYHEFSHPYEMTKKLIEALKPGGRLVFVEYRMEDPKVPILLVHKMTKKQVLKEMSIHPEMRHAQTLEMLPWQHIIIFEKKKK